MRKYKFIIVVALIAVLLVGCKSKFDYTSEFTSEVISHSSTEANGTTARIMSSNVLKVAWADESKETTADRMSVFKDVLDHYSPDVVGMQEYCTQWHRFVKQHCTDYAEIDLGKRQGDMTTIIYNKNTTELLDSGVEKFSEYSTLTMRYIAWGKFKDKASNKSYYTISIHYDFAPNGEKSADPEKWNMHLTQAKETVAFAKKLATDSNLPIFMVGDCNAINEPNQEAYDIYNTILKEFGETYETRGNIEAKFAVPAENQLVLGTCNAELYTDAYYAYDHIFYKGNAEILSYNLLKGGSYMSDHYSVYADVKLA